MKVQRCRLLMTLAALIWCVPSAGASHEGGEDGLLVFAAASLTDVLDEIGKVYESTTGKRVKFSFAASSALARQIEAGAGRFIRIRRSRVDGLSRRPQADRGGFATQRRRESAGADRPGRQDNADRSYRWARSAQHARKGRLAMADPDIVPAGRYAKAALETLHGWSGVRDGWRARRTSVSRSPMSRPARRRSASCTKSMRVEPRVRIVGTFPAESHPQIRYPAALTSVAGGDAKGFLDFLGSPQARAAFTRHGFVTVE